MSNKQQGVQRTSFCRNIGYRQGGFMNVENCEEKKPFGSKQDEFCCKEVRRQILGERINV